MSQGGTQTATKQPAGSKSGRNAIFFALSLVLAFVLTRFLSAKSFTYEQEAVLFLLFFSIGLWLTEATPPFAVGLFIMAYLVFMLGNAGINPRPQNIAKYVETFSNSIIWLMLGGFFLAEAMTKTGIDAYFFRYSIRLSGTKPKNILLGVMLTTWAASMILSNSATTSMVIASMMPLLLSQKEKSFTKALLAGIPMAAAIGGMATIIGSPTNAIAVGALENKGVTVSFTHWMAVGIPISIVLLFVGWYFLTRIYVRDNEPLDTALKSAGQEESKEKKKARVMVLVILCVTMGLWMTSSFHHLGVALVAAIPIVFLPMTRILEAADIRKLPWDTLLLVAGGLSLGLALQETKLLEHFAGKIMEAQVSPLVLMLIFAYITMLFSNIMSNSATSTILIPLGIYLMPDHAIQIAITIGLAASTGMLLPVSTPPVAIAYSTGLIRQKDFIPGGLLIGLLGPALIVMIVRLIA